MNKELKRLSLLAKNNNLKLLPVMENLTKKDVYVVVDTPKKAKKLKKVLDMFGEEYSDIIECVLLNKHEYFSLWEFNNATFMEYNEWSVLSSPDDDKTKVSIKKLKNILASEKLKKGDYVVCEDKGDVAIGVFKEWDSRFGFDIDNCRYKDGLTSNGGCFDNFKRYATPEEIALLEPKNDVHIPVGFRFNHWGCNNRIYTVTKVEHNTVWIGWDGLDNRIDYSIDSAKEFIRTKVWNEVTEQDKFSEPKGLEVGKWYRYGSLDSLMVWNKGNETYGFFEGSYDIYWAFGYDSIESAVEATPQEVEKALIEEAKRIGFYVGYESGHYVYFSHDKDWYYNEKANTLHVRQNGDTWNTIFNNGKWAQVIDKFAELKEAHKNGEVIQIKERNNEWYTISSPQWDIDAEYRIKPEEKPKVGDVVRGDYGDDFVVKILRPSELNSPLFKYTKLTQQEAIDLLFNDKS